MRTGATCSSAVEPFVRATPDPFQFSHRFARPTAQNAQLPQVSVGSTDTRSPGANSVTWSPTASTTPEVSWPGMIGKTVGANSPSSTCRSVPQSPTASTRTSTSRGPTSGSGTSSRLQRPGSAKTIAASRGCLYFTAPMAKPRTSRFWASQPATITGSTATVQAADRTARN